MSQIKAHRSKSSGEKTSQMEKLLKWKNPSDEKTP
jgi:hypothetical protein